MDDWAEFNVSQQYDMFLDSNISMLFYTVACSKIVVDVHGESTKALQV